jgi:hypothetical protein
MPKLLTGEKIDELSVVFKTGPDGKEWGPRNPEARILGVKGGPKTNWFDRAVEAVRKGFAIPGVEKKGYLVNDGVPDNVDNDGDGARDYEQIYGLLASTYYDLQSVLWVGDSEARSMAVCALIDNFLENLDDIRSGGDGSVHKAGARHSKGDLEKMNAMKDHADKISASADVIKTLHGELTATEKKDDATDSKDQNKDGGDGEGQDKGGVKPELVMNEDGLMVEKADAETEDSDYADPGYQSDKKKRYPCDTKEHAKAAWSYINKESNASKYGADDLAKVKAKIKAACEKFGVEIEGESKGSPTDTVTLAFDPKVVTDAIAPIAEMVEALKASVETKFGELEAKVATAEKAGATKLAESIEALKSARSSSMPGALGTLTGLNGEGGAAYKGSGLILSEIIQPEVKIDPHMPAQGEHGAIRTLLRAGRAAQG